MPATERLALAPSPWADCLVRSKAEIAAGQVVPLLPVLDRIFAAADRLEAGNASEPNGPEPAE